MISNRNPTDRYRPDIDALRGIAVALVVVYHAFPNLLPGGFIGVDVFFVISGFLITQLIHEKLSKSQFSLIDFYKRRCKRILPAYLAVILTVLVLGWLVLYPDEYKQLGFHTASASIFVLNWSLISELGYFDVESHYKPLLHLWSLSVEEQFYLIWPFLLLTIYRLKLNVKWTIFAITVLSFGINIYLSRNDPDTAFFHSGARFWELGAGAFLALVLAEKPEKKFKLSIAQSTLLASVSLIVIIFCSIFLNGQLRFPGWFAALPILSAVGFIIANAKLNHWGGLVSLGLISYPLYLWHWVLISFVTIYIGNVPSFTVLIFIISLSLLLSVLTYYFIESLRYSKIRSVPLILIFLSLFVGFAGFKIFKNEGLPNRPHLNTTEALQASFERTAKTDTDCLSFVNQYLQLEPEFLYCRSEIRTDETPDLVILGDSHGHAIFPGISDVAAKFGQDTLLLASSSCPPFIGFMWGRSPEEVERCQKSIEQRLKVIDGNKDFATVIIVARGPVYIHGDIKDKFTDETVSANLKKLIGPDRDYKNYENGLRQTFEELQAYDHVKNVFVLLENPELDFLPKEIVPRPFDIWGNSIGNSTVSKRLYELRMANYQQSVFNAASDSDKVQVLNLTSIFCDEDTCYSYKDGNFLYADDDHFSVFGSQYVAQRLEKQIFGDK